MLVRLASLLGTAAVAGVLAVVPAAPAAAAVVTAPCLPDGAGPMCQVWTGKVVRVNDGDTLSVDLAGDGTGTPRSIRLINAQAMEQTVYSSVPQRRRGECHSVAATARLEQLVKAGGGQVRLTAQHAASSSRNRPLRSVAVRINGVWRDVGLDLLRHGLALWQPFGGEWAWNPQYRVAQAQAARDGRNIFDADTCGTGPAQRSPLAVVVNYDAEGADDRNLNGEWVRVENRSDAALPLAGWWVRDSALRRYTFPKGTVVPARDAVYLHVGSGTPTATHKFWGLTAPAFDNPTSDAEAHGDGAYLFDPQGDLRGWMQYPCVLSCPAAPAGRR
ncbi:lamin tail domain-containing protein [Actinoplanes sp. NPDC049599]|uniref:lamin tail domain-containing protein n=1 Tax=Actinoplanes sp. NPDC049599 TaxID=3363903 RepID=UPI0037AA72B4